VGLTQRGLQVFDLVQQSTLPFGPGFTTLSQADPASLKNLLLPVPDRRSDTWCQRAASAAVVSPRKTLSTMRSLSSTGITGGRAMTESSKIRNPTYEPANFRDPGQG
jgi:hypothetical protein